MSVAPRQLPSLLLRLVLLAAAAGLAWYVRTHPGGGPATGSLAQGPAPAVRAEAPADAGMPAAGFGARVGFRSRERWIEHWEKHGREFRSLGVRTADAYLAFAQAMRDRRLGDDLMQIRRADGTFTRFDRATGTFLAFDEEGVIRTCFRPNDGEAYFRRQAERGSP